MHEEHRTVSGDGTQHGAGSSIKHFSELSSHLRPDARRRARIVRKRRMNRSHDPPGQDPTPLLITVPEAARLLAVGRTSLYQLIWDGELTVVRIGRCVRLTIAELERFVNERTATYSATG
jgi:excisionase family DNA binding protein